MFTVCVLGYSDHVDLLRRCLTSIAASCDRSLIAQLQVALNAPTRELRKFALEAAGSMNVPALVIEPAGGQNVGKYPLMRRMLRELRSPEAVTSRFMWFDDDSFVRPGTPFNWWTTVLTEAQGSVLLGSPYTQHILGRQAEAVRLQPWYTGKAVQNPFHFVTGGWWVADPCFLLQWDYPFPALHHKGGDVMLGELCRQQGAVVHHFNRGIAINADAFGNESRALRHGLSNTTLPVWQKFDPSRPDSVAHHKFDLIVRRL